MYKLFTYNELLIKLFILIDKKHTGLSHSDFFQVGIFSFNKKPSYIMPALNIDIKINFDENIEHFADYDFNILVDENKSSNNLFIKPLNNFYNPRYYRIDNSLHIAYIECKKFFIPQQIVYNESFIYPLEETIKILKESHI